MDREKDSSAENETSFGRSIDQNALTGKLDLIIQKHLRKSDVKNLAKLQEWHDEYKMADVTLKLGDSILGEVKPDELDEEIIGMCIAELANEIIIKDRLCGSCQHLFDNWPDLSKPSQEPVIARECHTLVFEAGDWNGCRFCAFMMQVLRDTGSLDTFRKVEVRLECLHDQTRASISLKQCGDDCHVQWINLPGKICKDSNYGIALHTWFSLEPSAHAVDTNDDQRDVFEIANDWITECSRHHDQCKQEEQDILPTRLIYIGSDTPRLVLTADWETKRRYSTLSYAWGISDFIKLTAKTYNSFLSTIPSQEFPKTFKDAIHITQQLGLEYIWIDALCIIQGDADDWRNEASLMSSVYGGSFINIAASSATDVHGGCLLNSPRQVHGLQVSITVNGTKSKRRYCYPDTYLKYVTESHLATRAWALQEKVLPSRTIHFGNRGAFWECKMMIANEDLPDGIDVGWHIGLINERDRQENFQAWWAKIVRLYSSANLTYGQDKLPAIAGIARNIYKERGGRYLAGMWQEEDIEAQLCWHTWPPQKRPSWRAPSWSWISVDSNVWYLRRDNINPLENSYAHILDAEMLFVDQNPFGEVRGGRLRIGCSGMLAARYSSKKTIEIENNSTDLDVDVQFGIVPDYEDAGCMDGDGIVYLLPILGGTVDKNAYDLDFRNLLTGVAVVGILLSKNNGKRGEFSRIGKFQYSKKDKLVESSEREEAYLYDSFLEAFEHKAASVAKMCVLR